MKALGGLISMKDFLLGLQIAVCSLWPHMAFSLGQLTPGVTYMTSLNLNYLERPYL